MLTNVALIEETVENFLRESIPPAEMVAELSMQDLGGAVCCASGGQDCSAL